MILVTGATGFIGRSLMPQLMAAGQSAVAHNGRINNPLELRPQLDGVNTVIHLAGAEARGRNRLLQHVDIEGTERLIEECQRAGINHLIVISRLGADHNAIHPLLRAKGEVERRVRKSGLSYTIVQTATVYGQGDHFSELIASMAILSWPFVWLPGGGKVMMQPLWVEDLARCLIAIVDNPATRNRTIPLAGEEQIHYRTIVQHILRIIGRKRFFLPIPLIILRPLTTVLFRWWYVPGVSHYFVDRFFVPEITRFDTVLHHFGFRPVRFSQTITYLNRRGIRWRLFRRRRK